ncbi:hypothetical protein BGW38_002247, partial [Lunasporangiospora selenospora]
MSVLTDPAYIVHMLRLSNLRLDDRTSDKVIAFPPQLLSNEYIKTAGPIFPEMQYCYSPNITYDYMMLGGSSLLLGEAANREQTTYSSSSAAATTRSLPLVDNGAGNSSVPVDSTRKLKHGGRVKYDRRKMVAAQAAAAAAAAGLGRGGAESGHPDMAFQTRPAAVPVIRVPVPVTVASLESDDDIDIDDDEPLKSPPRALPKTVVGTLPIGGNFAPGILITTPSRPGSASIAEEALLPVAHQHASDAKTKADESIEPRNDNHQEPTLALSGSGSILNERDTDLGDMTIDSITSPIELSPPESSMVAVRIERASTSSSSALMYPVPIHAHLPGVNRDPPSRTNDLLFRPAPVPRSPPVSLLTSLIAQQKSKDDNPFAEEFLRFAGMGETTPVQLKIYLPASDRPKDPMQVVVRREATVEDVIGYILYQYYNESRVPLLTDEQSTVVQWNLRIVEDDGEIDDDLPAVERTLKIGRFSMNQRFAMNQFALCEATPAQVQINEALYAKSGRTVVRPSKRRPSAGTGPPEQINNSDTALQGDGQANHSAAVYAAEAGNGASNAHELSSTAGYGAGGNTGTSLNTGATGAHVVPTRIADPLMASTQHYVRVRLHTNDEVKHTTTVEIMPKMLVSGVIEYICKKRKMKPEEWSLVVADTRDVLPLNGAAEDISNTTELALVPKSSEANINPKRSRFGRNGPADIPGSDVSYLTSTEVYREYTLSRKRRGGYVGHHEQVLAIDGDYIRIMPSSSRNLLFDSGKTSSYLKNTIYDCRQSRKAPSHFKFTVVRGDRERKTYEFEAKTPQLA